MCYWQAAMIAVQVAGQVGSSVTAAKAQKRAAEANGRIMMQKANIENANIRMQMIDAIDQARQQNTNINLEKFQTLSMMNNMMGESLIEGQSVERLKRGVAANFERQKADVTFNLNKDYAAMYHQQLSNSLTTYQNAEMLKLSQPTKTEQAWGTLGKGAQGAMNIYNAYQQGKSGGK